MSNIRKCKKEDCNNVLCNRTQSGNIYCSKECWAEDGTNKRIALWLSGGWDGSRKNGEISSTVRKYLLKQSEYKCSECGWNKINPITERSPLEVDHIDGNSENNVPTNLKVLCPNCHSLTPTYKALNITGRGVRAYRRKYNQFDLVGRKEKDWTKLTCICGASKARTSKQCTDCRNLEMGDKANLDYPPNKVMVAEIKRIGLEKYAPTLGKTSNAVKKHLKKQGYTNDDLRIEREVKVVHCSTCKVQLTVEEVKMGRVRCADHTVVSADYPPLEEVIAGVKELGYTGYAHRIGLKYGSSVRKYLKKRNIEI